MTIEHRNADQELAVPDVKDVLAMVSRTSAQDDAAPIPLGKNQWACAGRVDEFRKPGDMSVDARHGAHSCR